MFRRGNLFLLFLITCSIQAEETPIIPVGLDAYRQWDRWPVLRIGVRAYMRSTYDRRGGNEGADASHFLYQLAEDRNVTLDVQGPGVLYFARYNHWHGSPWHYEVDGVDHLIRETSTFNPAQPGPNSVFQPESAFPAPLTWTWATTQGADLMWVPIPFEKSFRMAYGRTHYGTGYYNYHQFIPGARLSQPIRSWSEHSVPASDVLELISKSGTDLLPPADSSPGRKMRLKALTASVAIPGHGSVTVAHLVEGASTLRAVEFTVPRKQAIEFGRCRLRMTWDNSPYASVDSPVALFFGAGTLYNRDDREFLVKGFPMNIRFDADTVRLACYFPMPFFRSAHLELANDSGTPIEAHCSLRYMPSAFRPAQAGYFHATWRDHPDPEPGQDLVLMDTRSIEGGGDWSGHLVGTSWIFSTRAVLNTLEGDPRFFFDDSQTPQAQGTGTEEWGGGGDYWGGRNMTLPFAGHPTGARNANEAKDAEDKIESAYRFLLADLMPFGKNAIIRLEHGGQNESTEHYQTLTYWYGLNRPSLLKTDSLKIGDNFSERAHAYTSPDASPPYEITSRYEWGVDSLNGREIFPATTDIGRKTGGVSEFNLTLDPANAGVMLRRKLDYQFPNQRAEVSISAVDGDSIRGPFKSAGIWYLAGGNTCAYSNPREELGAAQHVVQTSNRRFRDDEFLIPLALTRHRSEIRVRVQFTPVDRPLFPGQPLPELAWSEIRYEAWCFVMP